MIVRFKCQNFYKNFIRHIIVCKIDGIKFKLKTDKDGFSAIASLDDGPHVLDVAKRSFYDNPLCYINAFNPFFYLWQLKFLNRKCLGYDEAFAAIKITFESFDDLNSYILLELNRINKVVPEYGEYVDFSVVQKEGIKRICITKPTMNSKQIKRYKLTRIISALLYMAIVNIFVIFDYVNSGNVMITETIILCALITFLSLNIVYNTFKMKRVKK